MLLDLSEGEALGVRKPACAFLIDRFTRSIPIK
jgi:hypothetical protein